MKRELIITSTGPAGREHVVSIEGRGVSPAVSGAEGSRGSIEGRGLSPAVSGAEGSRGSIEGRDGPQPEGRFAVTIDGTERLVDGRQIRPGTWSILIDGRAVIVDLDPRRGALAASVASASAGEVVLTVEDARQRKAAARGGRTAKRGETIQAPIAGKVVKVLVEVGEVVTAGRAVIVLEAMKMENELISERGGTVTAVHKQAGQAVDTGDLLVELA